MKKHAALIISIVFMGPACFASSVCEVIWDGQYNTPQSLPDGAYVVECDGGAAQLVSKSYSSRTATLKVLGDKGYKIVAGGDRVILQKD